MQYKRLTLWVLVVLVGVVPGVFAEKVNLRNDIRSGDLPGKLLPVLSGRRGPCEPAVVKPLEGRVRVLSEYPPEYETVDEIGSGTMTRDWWTDQELTSELPLFMRREVTSPLDGSTALEQVVMSAGGPTADHRMLRRIYRLGRTLSPASRLAVFVSVERLQPHCSNDSAGISIVLMRNGRGLTRQPYLLAAHGGVFFANQYFPNVVKLPDRFTGILDIPLDFADEPFDTLCLSMANYCAVGSNYTILDEVRILPVPVTDQSPVSQGRSGPDQVVRSVSVKPASAQLHALRRGAPIILEAVVDKATPVTFQLVSPDGTVLELGAAMTVQRGLRWVATLQATFSSLQSAGLRPGIFRIVAVTAGEATRSTTLTIRDEI